jgi:rhamnosyltransferase
MTTPYVVMRSHNDMPLIAETLASLSRQDRKFTLLCLDNDSTDGTVEEIRKYTDRIVNIPKGTYVPGRVLNLGMKLSEGERTVFLNSDCTPVDDHWLGNLLAGFSGSANVAAVFGRQIPRPDCHPLFAKDTEDAYGDGSRQKYWRHCFSMASSAVSRAVWEAMPFDESLAYSEDIDWTWRARGKGYEIRYVRDAVALHSHNYTLRQFYRRHYGEGRAEADIFEWSKWEASLLRYSLMPFARQVLSDLRYCLSRGLLAAACSSPLLRAAQMLGRRKGFRSGLRKGR